MKVPRDQVIAFGIYTTSNNTLKLSAQLFPLYPEESREVKLAFYQNNIWRVVQTEQVNEIGWSVLFRIENFDMSKDIRYKIMHGETAYFEGLIRKDPINKAQITLAALSCNSNKDRGDRDGYVRNINTLNPDLILRGFKVAFASSIFLTFSGSICFKLVGKKVWEGHQGLDPIDVLNNVLSPIEKMADNFLWSPVRTWKIKTHVRSEGIGTTVDLHDLDVKTGKAVVEVLIAVRNNNLQIFLRRKKLYKEIQLRSLVVFVSTEAMKH